MRLSLAVPLALWQIDNWNIYPAFPSANQLILEPANQPKRLIPHVWMKGLNLNDSTAEYSACSIVA
jgi:hypothetical protein